MAITPEILLEDMSSLVTFFEAIGGLVVAYIVFNTINIIWNRKKNQDIHRMMALLEDIDKKLSKKK